jgi:hypothetical protein
MMRLPKIAGPIIPQTEVPQREFPPTADFFVVARAGRSEATEPAAALTAVFARFIMFLNLEMDTI